MKLFLSFFLLNFCFSFCYGQSIEKIPIPVLKETAKIDSLIDIILNPNTQPNYHDDAKPLQDSCIILSMLKAKDSSFSFYLSTQSKTNINRSINFLDWKKTSFGYFEYKGLKVFVHTNDYFYYFFSKTSNSKSFEFIYKLKEDNHRLEDGIMPRGSRAWNFKYKDGFFLQWFLQAAQ